MSETPTTRHDPALDGLRGLAVLLVYVYHYGGGLKSSHAIVRAFGHITEASWVGVTIFFALSGFLITGSLWGSIGEPHWLRNFYARRALRIFPLYYFVIAASVIATVISGVTTLDLWPYAIHAFFLQDLPILSVFAGRVPGPVKMYHFWTLAIEEHFYLFWPAILLFARTRRRALQLCMAIFLLSAIFRIAVFAGPGSQMLTKYFQEFPLTHVGTLALGAALALLLRSDSWSFVQRYAFSTFAIGFIGFVAISYAAGTAIESAPLQLSTGLFFVSLLSAATIPLALRPNAFRSTLSIAPLRFLGRISYGFYIFHILLETVFDHLATRLTHTADGQRYQLARFVLAFPLSLTIAWLSYRFFETPFLRLKSRFPATAPLSSTAR